MNLLKHDLLEFFFLRYISFNEVFLKRNVSSKRNLESMIHLSINLSPRHRLDLRLIKRRKNLDTPPLFPKPGKIFAIKKGSKISRFFRYFFSNKKIQKILGINLAAIFISSSLIQFPFSSTKDIDIEPDITIDLTTKQGVQYPVKEVRVTQGYSIFHPGLDLDGETGDPIYPIMAGKVEAIDHSKYAYGNAILINHGNEITSLYAHLSEIEVTQEQQVSTETEIGKMGATGHASGDHLHLEIRDHGTPINPYSVLPRQ
jgi:murein DD-endopeptidase MepM/ murein hydrolase activator NlpD